MYKYNNVFLSIILIVLKRNLGGFFDFTKQILRVSLSSVV